MRCIEVVGLSDVGRGVLFCCDVGGEFGVLHYCDVGGEFVVLFL